MNPSPIPLEYCLDVPGPFLGLDVGNVRIGIAVSDALALLARPLATLERRPHAECLDALCRILDETGARGLVVGLPRLEGGEEGEQARRTRAFITQLRPRLAQRPVIWWDERYTTAEAREHPAVGRRGQKRRGGGHAPQHSSRDEIAASILLQEWLDERRRMLARIESARRASTPSQSAPPEDSAPPPDALPQDEGPAPGN